VGTATVRLPSFVDGDDDASTFSRAERLAFIPKPPLFSSSAGAGTGPLVAVEDAVEDAPVGFATVTCALHVREEHADAAEREDEAETAEGDAAGDEADGA
jgi:hypothetical protein